MRFLSVIFVVTVVAGCGGPSPGRPELVKNVVPVNGTLTYNGQVLENFMVSFHPPDGAKPGTGMTDPGGNFKLGTNDLADGCAAGSCKVAIAFAPPSGDGMGDTIDDPKKLPKPKINVPAKFANPETSGITVDVPKGGLKDYKLDVK